MNKRIRKKLKAALAAHQAGNLSVAEAGYREVLREFPDEPDALHLAGVLAGQKDDLPVARERILRAVKLKPDEGIFWNSLGAIESASGANSLALKYFTKAVELDPKLLEAWISLAGAKESQGDEQGMDEAFAHALELEPENPKLLIRIAESMLERQMNAAAAGVYERVAEIDPEREIVKGPLAFLYLQLCRWKRLPELLEYVREALESGGPAMLAPLRVLAMSYSARQQRRFMEGYAAAAMDRVKPVTPLPAPPEPGRQPIRVGYWSSDFHDHPVSHLTSELFELHDRSRVEVFMFSYGHNGGHPSYRERLVKAADHFIDVMALDNDETVKVIRDHRIDILIDLKGYTGNSRTTMLPKRAAAIQVNWLGFAGTLGTPHADYIIADDFVIPHGSEEFYTEKVARMPVCYMPSDRKRSIAEPRSRAEYGLPEEGLVFGSFNQPFKITPVVFDVWMNILRRVPSSTLWLKGADSEVEQNLRAEAERRSVDPSRLVFTKRVPLVSDHLARYRVVDLTLDTAPFCSHTTAHDSLWAGCPIVALTGETFASRVSGSLLRAVGLPELITTNLADYEELVVSLATDRERLAQLREKLQANHDSAPLFDTPRFARDLEDLFVRMIEEKAAEFDSAPA